MSPSPLNLQRREWKLGAANAMMQGLCGRDLTCTGRLPTRGQYGPANTHGPPGGCRMVFFHFPSPGVNYLHVFPQCFKKTQQVSSPQWYAIKLEAIKVYGLRNSMQRFNMHNKYQQYFVFKVSQSSGPDSCPSDYLG